MTWYFSWRVETEEEEEEDDDDGDDDDYVTKKKQSRGLFVVLLMTPQSFPFSKIQMTCLWSFQSQVPTS